VLLVCLAASALVIFSMLIMAQSAL
jgi:hypothetical protein